MMGMGGGGGVHMFMWGGRGDQTKKKPTIAMYRRLLRFVGPYRWNLAVAAALLIVSTALGLVWPQIVQRVLDLGLKEPGLLDQLVVVLVAVLLVRAVVDGVVGRMDDRGEERLKGCWRIGHGNES
jgi:ABC-type multidrug transport system fused ATPase/permease subunit